MLKVHLITVGKLKDSSLKSVEHEYLKRLSLIQLSIHEVKAHGGDKESEAKEVLKKIQEINPLGKRENNLHIVLLAENGKQYDSIGFAQWFFELSMLQAQIVLIMGGAEGHGEEILRLANSRLSLSALTFPHQLARVILVEQLYRAQSIQQKHPYHK